MGCIGLDGKIPAWNMRMFGIIMIMYNVHLTAAYMKKNCHGAVGCSLFLERAQKVLCISAASVVRAISFHLFH